MTYNIVKQRPNFHKLIDYKTDEIKEIHYPKGVHQVIDFAKQLISYIPPNDCKQQMSHERYVKCCDLVRKITTSLHGLTNENY